MSRTLQDLLNGVLNRLNEAQATVAFQLESGGGNTAALTSTVNLTRWLNEAQWEIARNSFLIGGKAAAYTTAGFGNYNLKDFAATMYQTRSTANLFSDGSTAWVARQVYVNGTAMTYCSVEFLSQNFPGHETLGAADPIFWMRNGEGGIKVWPTPPSAYGITAIGYVQGPDLGLSATCTWFPDSLTPIIECRAALLAVEHSFEDLTLFGRYGYLAAEYAEARTQLYLRIPPTIVRDIKLLPPPSYIGPPQEQPNSPNPERRQ